MLYINQKICVPISKLPLGARTLYHMCGITSKSVGTISHIHKHEITVRFRTKRAIELYGESGVPIGISKACANQCRSPKSRKKYNHPLTKIFA